MTIGALIAETLAMKRAAECEHDWARLNDTEEQRSRCTVIATEQDKKNLAAMKRRNAK